MKTRRFVGREGRWFNQAGEEYQPNERARYVEIQVEYVPINHRKTQEMAHLPNGETVETWSIGEKGVFDQVMRQRGWLPESEAIEQGWHTKPVLPPPNYEVYYKDPDTW